MHNKVHIAGRGSVVRQLRPEASGLASQFRVLRTGTLSDPEVSGRPDNMYQPLPPSWYDKGTSVTKLKAHSLHFSKLKNLHTIHFLRNFVHIFVQ